MNKVVFISFADKKYYTSLRRLETELQGFHCITEYHLYTEHDLGADFLADFHPKIYRRGYGYWKWKPYLVWRELQRLDRGDILIWSDAGTVLNPDGEPRLLEYIDKVRTSDTGILAFQDQYMERQYTKGDVFARFGVLDNAAFTDTPQFWGGLSLTRKCEKSVAVVNEWWTTARDHYLLITDRRSTVPNYPEFTEARHDQSVFSVLMKKHQAAIIPSTEFDKSNYPHIPFLPIRSKQKTRMQNLSGKLLIPLRLAIGLYLKYIMKFDFKNRIAW